MITNQVFLGYSEKWQTKKWQKVTIPNISLQSATTFLHVYLTNRFNKKSITSDNKHLCIHLRRVYFITPDEVGFINHRRETVTNVVHVGHL